MNMLPPGARRANNSAARVLEGAFAAVYNDFNTVEHQFGADTAAHFMAQIQRLVSGIRKPLIEGGRLQAFEAMRQKDSAAFDAGYSACADMVRACREHGSSLGSMIDAHRSEYGEVSTAGAFAYIEGLIAARGT